MLEIWGIHLHPTLKGSHTVYQSIWLSSKTLELSGLKYKTTNVCSTLAELQIYWVSRPCLWYRILNRTHFGNQTCAHPWAKNWRCLFSWIHQKKLISITGPVLFPSSCKKVERHLSVWSETQFEILDSTANTSQYILEAHKSQLP
jgi:hypothetical protein